MPHCAQAVRWKKNLVVEYTNVRAKRKTPDMSVKNLKTDEEIQQPGPTWLKSTDAKEYFRPMRDHCTMTAARRDPPTPHTAW